MNRELRFRPYAKTDDSDLSRLMGEILGVHVNEAFWRWKYRNNPVGQALSTVALENGRVIGHIGAIPTRFVIDGQEYTGTQEVDIFVEEEYRKLKTFFNLYNLRCRINEENRIAFSYGFTIEITSKIARGVMRFGRVGPITRLVKPLDIKPFLNKKIPIKTVSRLLSPPVKTSMRLLHSLRARIPTGAVVRSIERFDERFDAFWHRVKWDYPIMTVRDSTYLNWRYIEVPHLKHEIISMEKEETGEIMGFVVLRERHRDVPVGQIVDIVTPRTEDGTVARNLVSRAIDRFYENKMALVSCWMFPHCHVFPELISLGFRRREKEGRELIFRHMSMKMPGIPTDFALKEENWYICIGDSDFF